MAPLSPPVILEWTHVRDAFLVVRLLDASVLSDMTVRLISLPLSIRLVSSVVPSPIPRIRNIQQHSG